MGVVSSKDIILYIVHPTFPLLDGPCPPSTRGLFRAANQSWRRTSRMYQWLGYGMHARRERGSRGREDEGKKKRKRHQRISRAGSGPVLPWSCWDGGVLDVLDGRLRAPRVGFTRRVFGAQGRRRHARTRWRLVSWAFRILSPMTIPRRTRRNLRGPRAGGLSRWARRKTHGGRGHRRVRPRRLALPARRARMLEPPGAKGPRGLGVGPARRRVRQRVPRGHPVVEVQGRR